MSVADISSPHRRSHLAPPSGAPTRRTANESRRSNHGFQKCALSTVLFPSTAPSHPDVTSSTLLGSLPSCRLPLRRHLVPLRGPPRPPRDSPAFHIPGSRRRRPARACPVGRREDGQVVNVHTSVYLSHAMQITTCLSCGVGGRARGRGGTVPRMQRKPVQRRKGERKVPSSVRTSTGLTGEPRCASPILDNV